MSWLCNNCETLNDDNDCVCVVCNSLPPSISEITVDYYKELITWTNNDVCELKIKYSQGVFNVTGLTSFKLIISTDETIVFIAKNNVAERIFRFGLSYSSVQNLLKSKEKYEEEIWLQAFRKNTVEAYKDYIVAYPGGPHAKEARRRIGELEDDICWNTSLANNTLLAYRSYEKNYSSGRHIAQCKRRINEIIDNEAWRAALLENTVEGYNYYLKHFNSPLHALEAKEKIKKASSSRTGLILGVIAAIAIVIFVVFTVGGGPNNVCTEPTVTEKRQTTILSSPDNHSAEIRKTHAELEKLFKSLEDSKSNGYNHPNPDGLSEIRKRINRLENFGDSSVGKYKDRLILLTQD